MRKTKLVEGEYYHIYNRGVEKRDIFADDSDRWRFMTLLCVLQSEVVIPNINRIISNVKHSMFNNELMRELLSSKTVDLVSFCLMSNHFHCIIRCTKENGLSKYMQRLGNAYTKYFNTRHGRTGHLFGSGFHSIHIDKDEYLNYLSAYIHLNPRELPRWRGKEHIYPWSSYQDYIGTNRWGGFLATSVFLDQFKDATEYKLFLDESDIKNTIDSDYLLD